MRLLRDVNRFPGHILINLTSHCCVVQLFTTRREGESTRDLIPPPSNVDYGEGFDEEDHFLRKRRRENAAWSVSTQRRQADWNEREHTQSGSTKTEATNDGVVASLV